MTTSVRWQDAVLGATGTGGLFLLWELASRSGLVSPNVFPAPTTAIVGTLQTVPLSDVALQLCNDAAQVSRSSIVDCKVCFVGASSTICRLSASRARRNRLRTVPSGMSSTTASSGPLSSSQ